MIRKLAVLTAALGMFAVTQADAADLPRKAPAYAPVAAPFTWTGFYTGVYGGYGFNGKVDTNLTGLGAVDTGLSPSGGFGGSNVGYNWQIAPNWVFGLEADFSYGKIEDSSTLLAVGPFALGSTSRLDYFGTGRARLGVTTGPWMFYGTGGLAWGHNEATLNVSVLGSTARIFDDNYHFGWTAGGGAEWAINRNWSVKAEYLYVDLGGEDYHFVTGTAPVNVDVKFHTVKVGANFKFDLGTLFAP